MMRSTFFLCTLILLPGCLKTMADLRSDGDMEQTVPARSASASPGGKSAQAHEAVKPAPVTTASRFEEMDEQLRHMNGRLEELEAAIGQQKAARQSEQANQAKEREASQQRLTAYEEEIKRLEAQVLALNEEVTRLKTAPPPPAPVVAAAPTKGRGPFDDGDERMQAKKWREAIVSFQKYRDGNPKGKLYPEATYKMGLSFQELGMKDEARAFFEEVTSKFPGSKEAKKAGLRLKTLK